MRRERLLAAGVILLAVLLACAHRVNQGRAEALIRAYLGQHYDVKGLALTDMGPAPPAAPGMPGAEAVSGAVGVRASFVVNYHGHALPFENQPFFLTYNRITRDWEVNPSLTFVLEAIQNRCTMQDCSDYADQHPDNPTFKPILRKRN